jgi:NADPH:quinone reductase-like Zn-dependent oxidoreductase
MKAYEIHRFGIDELVLAEREIPKPRAGEVLVKFAAFSINRRDLMVIEGTYNPRLRMPAVPFSDAAGEVVEVGEGVKRWKAGDRVSPIFMQKWIGGDVDLEKAKTAIGAGSRWDGVLREYAVFDEEGLVKIPEHLSFEEAATLPCVGVTVWNALCASGNLKAGETVLTLGTGGVSVAALQIAKLFGAEVIATSSSDEKLGRMAALGAGHTINYREREDWDAAVLELTDGKGVDHVVEVGGAGTLGRSVSAAKIGGHVALIGALDGGGGDFSPTKVLMKAIRVQGIYVGSRSHFEDLNRAVSINRMKPVIDSVFGFDEAAAALEHMKSGSHFGKIIIKI